MGIENIRKICEKKVVAYVQFINYPLSKRWKVVN